MLPFQTFFLILESVPKTLSHATPSIFNFKNGEKWIESNDDITLTFVLNDASPTNQHLLVHSRQADQQECCNRNVEVKNFKLLPAKNML